MLSTLWQLAIVIGIVLASLCNLPLARWDEGWRLSYGGNAFPAAVLLLMMLRAGVATLARHALKGRGSPRRAAPTASTRGG